MSEVEREAHMRRIETALLERGACTIKQILDSTGLTLKEVWSAVQEMSRTRRIHSAHGGWSSEAPAMLAGKGGANVC